MYSVMAPRQNDMKVLQFRYPPRKAKVGVGPLVNLERKRTQYELPQVDEVHACARL